MTCGTALALRLVREIGVAGVPGAAFHADRAEGARQLRFAFPKQAATLRDAAARLASLSRRPGGTSQATATSNSEPSA